MKSIISVMSDMENLIDSIADIDIREIDDRPLRYIVTGWKERSKQLLKDLNSCQGDDND